MKPTAKQLLDLEASRLVINQPFFGALILQLERKADETVKTTSVDGRVLKYNPKWIESIPEESVSTVLARNVLFCALGHIFRKGHRNKKKWEAACAYSVNGVLTEFNSIKLPQPFPLLKGDLHLPAWNDKASEEVYEMLPDEPGKAGKGASDYTGGEMGDESGSADSHALEQEWKMHTQEAANTAERQGNLPSKLKHLVTEFLNPKVPWQMLLRRFVTATARDDHSWKRPNKKFLSQGLYLPSLHSQKAGRIAVALDSSGSTYGVWAEFTAEIQAILDDVQPEVLHFMHCDAAIGFEAEYTPGDRISRELTGGGGTVFTPVLDRLQSCPPICLVYLTDLQGTFPDYVPDYPVLWVTTCPGSAPFGEVIEMNR